MTQLYLQQLCISVLSGSPICGPIRSLGALVRSIGLHRDLTRLLPSINTTTAATTTTTTPPPRDRQPPVRDAKEVCTYVGEGAGQRAGCVPVAFPPSIHPSTPAAKLGRSGAAAASYSAWCVRPRRRRDKLVSRPIALTHETVCISGS